MKKKRFIIVFIGMVALLAGVFTVSAKTFQNNNSNEVGYTLKSIYDKMDDGWLYSFEIAYVENDPNIYYIFDGYNLKHRPSGIEYYVSYVDAETGKELEKIPSRYATLSTSEKYREDIKKINDFFNQSQFKQNISIDDLEQLEVENISKEYLVDLFNRTISSEIKNIPGEYISAPSLEWKTQTSTDESKPGEWQIMYILDYGYIQDIEIEFVNSDGTYLSEQTEKLDFSSADNELLENIETLEENIITSQNVNITTSRSDRNLINNSDLNKLLNDLNGYLLENN